jgi:hypothetical protein
MGYAASDLAQNGEFVASTGFFKIDAVFQFERFHECRERILFIKAIFNDNRALFNKLYTMGLSIAFNKGFFHQRHVIGSRKSLHCMTLFY